MDHWLQEVERVEVRQTLARARAARANAKRLRIVAQRVREVSARLGGVSRGTIEAYRVRRDESGQ